MPPDDLENASDEEIERWKAEWDVMAGLQELGHQTRVLGLRDEIGPLREAIQEWKPHVVFNMLEEFRGEVLYDQHVVGYLELLGIPVTGCNARGLIVARDKGLSKKILHYHRIRVPRFTVFPRGRRRKPPRSLQYPVIVKSLIEEASRGIAQASVVTGEDKLQERVRFVHETVGTDAVVEQFIDGREIYSGVLGNQRLEILPTWEIKLGGLPPSARRIATEKVKWDLAYQQKYNIKIGPARGLDGALRQRVIDVSKRIYRALCLSGYARIDFRLTEANELYFLEANPNPDISIDEEFASAAHLAGRPYPQLLEKILRLALRRQRGR